VPDGLAEHGGGDAVGGSLEQLPGKTAADAVAHIEEFADAEVVHQPELVVGEGVPRVAGWYRAGGFAAIGVALVHRDDAEVVFERLGRVEHRGRPVADPRVQASARRDQQRKPGADLLVADADVALLIKRHGSLSLHTNVPRPKRLDRPRSRDWAELLTPTLSPRAERAESGQATALRSSNSICTFCGPRRKAMRTPGRIVLGSTVNSAPLCFSSATTASMPSTRSPICSSPR
jgi:hypothetical protein